MKSIILFNNKEMTYAIVGINYTDDEAKTELDNLKDVGGFHIDQNGKTYSSEMELEERMKEITGGRVSRVDL